MRNIIKQEDDAALAPRLAVASVALHGNDTSHHDIPTNEGRDPSNAYFNHSAEQRITEYSKRTDL